MLKITWVTRKNRSQTLRLEGKLLEPWVETVRNSCAEQVARSRKFRLDLSGVSFVDSAGVELLRDLIRQGAEIVACSSFVAELLEQGDSS